jgi:hypothetical protein
LKGGVYLFDKPTGMTSRKASALTAGAWGYGRFANAHPRSCRRGCSA